MIAPVTEGPEIPPMPHMTAKAAFPATSAEPENCFPKLTRVTV